MTTSSPLERRLRDALARRGTAYGVWCSIGSAHAVEILADVGPDFVVLDRQHGLIEDGAMVDMLRAVARTDVSPLVRVSRNDATVIGQALDSGADGVIVPMIHDAEDARAAVEACRYPPSGRRSYGPARSAMLTTGTPTEVNDTILCIPLIESSKGAAAAAEICAVPNVGGVMIGMADLAIDLGLVVGTTSPELETAVSGVVEAARAAGVPVMIGASDAHRISDIDARMVVATTDVALLRSGLQRALIAIGDTPNR
ncbi:MAG: hypothetical protein JWO57_685 [Pseudonocardiales bacterium]|nr:hypothetical protein [Pseudonocardiales bacterium]